MPALCYTGIGSMRGALCLLLRNSFGMPTLCHTGIGSMHGALCIVNTAETQLFRCCIVALAVCMVHFKFCSEISFCVPALCYAGLGRENTQAAAIGGLPKSAEVSAD